MLFTMDKNKSLSILQLVMALFIMIAPSVTGLIDYSACVYIFMAFSGIMFVLRTVGKGQVDISVQHLVLMLMVIYSFLSLLWVSNRGMHLVYVAMIIAITGMFFLMTDYFSESTNEKIRRRMMYMISIGGLLCVCVNFLYWVTQLVPFGKKENFTQGIGSNHFLAVFMFLSMVVSVLLIRKNSSLRKCIFALSAVIMFLIFILSKSFYGWMFAVAVGIIFFAERKSAKYFFSISATVVSLFGIILLIVFFASNDAVAFKEVFSYGNLFGRGGGYLSESKLFFSIDGAAQFHPGLLSAVYAASGFMGILCLVLFVARIVMHYIKLRTWESVINLMVTFMMLFLPMATSFGTVLLWIGLTAYNENAAGGIVKRSFRPDVMKKIVYTVAAMCVIAIYLLCQRLMVVSANKKYNDGKYMEAYSLYKSAASVNPLDAESCIGVAQSLYKNGNIKEHYEDAIEFVEKAHSRDKKNISHNSVKAQLYAAGGKHDLAVQEYKYISSVAKVNSRYNLLCVESIYEMIKDYPEGSPETMEYYEEIVRIAKSTKDLDYREKINNIADKALVCARRRTDS